jgi:hypothetical protein|uniref:Uncharacterized protein n=1 Tax=Picea glauca TaxID=3330 RepID=A0A101M0V8_PICGL|nr:hypothetical protein ABT39_MTgene4315 [Picea glauca]
MSIIKYRYSSWIRPTFHGIPGSEIKGHKFDYNRFHKHHHSWTEGALLRYEGEGRGTSRSTVWERVFVFKNARGV